MKQALEQLQRQLYQLQKETASLYQHQDLETLTPYFHRIYFTGFNNKFDIYLYGLGLDEGTIDECQDNEGEEFEYYGQAFASLLELIINHPDSIASLHFDGPDEGVNGLSGWDFTRLVESDVVFQNLHTFNVKLYEAGHHNHTYRDLY